LVARVALCSKNRLLLFVAASALSHDHGELSDHSTRILARNIRFEADLADQLFHSSEKRLARVLLLLARYGKEGKPETDCAENQPRGLSRHGRHYPVARELFYE
jgi:hypothetical protein